MQQNPSNQKICARQIAFAAAFLLPAAKLLEVPSLLAEYAKGDLLLPALMHFLTQALVLLGTDPARHYRTPLLDAPPRL